MSEFFSFSPSVDNMWMWFSSIFAIVVIGVFIINILIRVVLSILLKENKV